ncbi:MAG: DUF1573 domain-containing protein [Bacteroidetes bacterium]|jgi:hypothetical protein|nr:DUF1573 domain-containing protein [Bacteroidota bacterium]MBT7994439.1 DUF1573 domain-containing protein [Bacteroidota bacterium]
MKRILLISTILLFSVSWVFCQPNIKFDETDHDFGDVIVNTYPKTTFKFSNIGDQPLVITNVKTSCGCTTPKWPKDSIMPGGTGEIEVVFNSRGYKNRKFAKSVIVSYNRDNGGNAKAEVLYIHGKVIPKIKEIKQYPLQISSNSIDFDIMKIGKKKEMTIELKNSGDSIIHIKEFISSCDKCMLISSEQLILEPQQTTTVKISYLTKSHEARSIHENIKIITSLDTKYLNELSVKGITVVGETLKGKDYKNRIKKLNE